MKLAILAAAGLYCVAAAGCAEARVRHHRHAHRHAARHTGYPVTIGYDDTIISGRTGLHRNDVGVMVPDGGAPNFVLTGRRNGSGLGANGLPGSNLDE